MTRQPLPSAFLVALAVVVGVRLTTLTAACAWSGLPPSTILAGHDGAEYLAFAEALARGDLAAIPLDARRHNPGWPLSVAPLAVIVPAWLAAVLIQWFSLAGAAAMLYGLIAEKTPRASPALVAAALLLGYPTVHYYATFALVDPLLLLLVVGAVYLHQNQRVGLAYGAVGLAALVRLPVALLGPALLLSDWRRGRLPTAVAWLPAVILPHLLWAVVTQRQFGSTFAAVHSPQFSYPFSALAGIGTTGTLRAAYNLIALALFGGLAVATLRQAHRSQWQAGLLNITAVFSTLYVLFHLCLAGLHYHGRHVQTFPYLDRYLAALWPFVVVLVAPKLTWRRLAPLIAVSVTLASLWTARYLDAARRDGTLGRKHRPDAAFVVTLPPSLL